MGWPVCFKPVTADHGNCTWHRFCSSSQKIFTIHLCRTQTGTNSWIQKKYTKDICQPPLGTSRDPPEHVSNAKWLQWCYYLYKRAGNCSNENCYIAPYPAASDHRIPAPPCLLSTNHTSLLHFYFCTVFLFNSRNLHKNTWFSQTRIKHLDGAWVNDISKRIYLCKKPKQQKLNTN